MRSTAEFIVRNRLAILCLVLASTLFFGFFALRIEMYTAFADLLPQRHPYLKVHNEFQSVFGSANVVLISVESRNGDIFNPKTLGKIKKITEVIELTPGANNYQIFSIARQKVKDVRATGWGIEVQPVMWPDVPSTPEGLEQLKRVIYANPTIVGRLVSEDGRAALVTAAFHEERLDYRALFRRLSGALRELEDADTAIFAAGEPILYGWIYHHLSQVAAIVALTCATIVALLVLYYRNLNGVLIPVISALITFVWGTGFTALMGYNFDPLVLVVPFLIAARTISHSIQFRERFFEELQRWGDKEKAAIESAAGLLMPGGVSIVTDAIGLTVLLVAPMPILTKLAIAGSFWVISNLVTVLVLDPILCCYLPVPRRLPRGGEGHWLDRPLRRLGAFATGPRGRYLVVAAFALIAGWSLYWYRFLTVGDSRPGSPLLWPDSEYNVSVRHINEKFHGTDQLNIIVRGKSENAMKSPEALRTVEALQRHLQRSPHVGGTDSLVGLVRHINSVLHHNDPRWGVVPRTADEVGGVLMIAEHGSEPGDFDRWVNYNFQHGNITVFLYDHRGDDPGRDRPCPLLHRPAPARRGGVPARQRPGGGARGRERGHRSLRPAHARPHAARAVRLLRDRLPLAPRGRFFRRRGLDLQHLRDGADGVLERGIERQHAAGREPRDRLRRGLRDLYRVARDRGVRAPGEAGPQRRHPRGRRYGGQGGPLHRVSHLGGRRLLGALAAQVPGGDGNPAADHSHHESRGRAHASSRAHGVAEAQVRGRAGSGPGVEERGRAGMGVRRRRLAARLGRALLVGALFCAAPAPAQRARLAVPAPVVQYAPLSFGVKHGLYRAEGIDLEISSARTDLAIAALGTGELDYIAHGGAALRAAAHGFPLRLVFALDDKAPFWLAVQPAVREVGALKGRKIGVSFPGDTPHLVLKRFLRRNGLDPERDVIYVSGQFSPTAFATLLAGAIDGAVLAPPYNRLAAQKGLRLLVFLGEAVPDAPTINGLITSERKIRSQPQQIKRVVRATLKATLLYRREPRLAIDFLASEYELDRKTAERVYRDAVAILAPGGEVGREKLRDSLALGGEAGQKPVLAEPERLLDFSFLREVKRELGEAGR
jgi:predicted RND superfamily exporter protein/ABC-type nitrate/sulfonate/bicarbonate transport system substrate-binding protein